MKKVQFLCSMLLALVLTFNAVASIPANFLTVTEKEATSKLVFTNDALAPTPFGYEVVTFDTATEENAKFVWLKANKTMEGYNFTEAQKLRAFNPIGSAPPCRCDFPSFPFKFIPKIGGGYECNDCGGGAACAVD